MKAEIVNRKKKIKLVREIRDILILAGVPFDTFHIGRIIAQTPDCRCENLKAMINIMQALDYDAVDIAKELLADFFVLGGELAGKTFLTDRPDIPVLRSEGWAV